MQNAALAEKNIMTVTHHLMDHDKKEVIHQRMVLYQLLQKCYILQYSLKIANHVNIGKMKKTYNTASSFC